MYGIFNYIYPQNYPVPLSIWDIHAVGWMGIQDSLSISFSELAGCWFAMAHKSYGAQFLSRSKWVHHLISVLTPQFYSFYFLKKLGEIFVVGFY